MKIVTGAALIRVAVFAGIFAILVFWVWLAMIRMPGRSYEGPLEPLTPGEVLLRDALRRDVEMLAGQIGQRNIFLPEKLAAAADFIKVSFAAAGYEVHTQQYEVQKTACRNIEVEIAGIERASEIIIVGAHYDSVMGCPGANDNATGTAAVLALARPFAGKKMSRTVRFVAFVNEEPPFFRTADMGSTVYARRCRQRDENIVAMLALETIGYYTDQPNSQKYPPGLSLFYPTTGNFIGFVGNFSSAQLVQQAISSFRRNSRFPSAGGALPDVIAAVSWSDHFSFQREGYPAIMVTDTAPFRYEHYHTANDTPEKIDYDRMAKVVAGLEKVVADLAGPAGQNKAQ